VERFLGGFLRNRTGRYICTRVTGSVQVEIKFTVSAQCVQRIRARVYIQRESILLTFWLWTSRISPTANRSCRRYLHRSARRHGGSLMLEEHPKAMVPRQTWLASPGVRHCSPSLRRQPAKVTPITDYVIFLRENYSMLCQCTNDKYG